jgi:hypothetical protein
MTPSDIGDFSNAVGDLIECTEKQIKMSAINAEIEGMKADNTKSQLDQNYIQWGVDDFQGKAEELRELLK